MVHVTDHCAQPVSPGGNSGKRLRNTIALVLVAVCFAVSALIAGLFAVLCVRAWFLQDTLWHDPEYAVLVADDQVVTKRYDIQRCRTLRFFDSDYYEQKTLFSNVAPNLKIVSDEVYYVEITANQTLQDALQIDARDGKLTVSFREDIYNRVHETDIEYDYDDGLYVDCSRFDITVHAPICLFYTDTNLKLDFTMAPANQVYLDFSYEGVQGEIRGIDANSFTLHCSGRSRLKLSGQVRDIADIMLWHDSRVDARQLHTTRWAATASRGIAGYSYVIGDSWKKWTWVCSAGPIFWKR